MIKRAVLVCEHKQDELNKRINVYIEAGFEPQGGVTVALYAERFTFAVLMVQHKEGTSNNDKSTSDS